MTEFTASSGHSSDARRRTSLGVALRRWRLFHRVKQTDAAERLGVAQSTVSRWEAGLQRMEACERIKVEALVATKLDAAADRVLAGLIEDASRPVHLICDHTHRLLACSKPREAELGRPYAELRGRSLMRFATEELLQADDRLSEGGWHDAPAPDPVVIVTGANRSRIVPIRPSRCRWTRLILSDGGAARLVETLPGG